jgi:hypothetical protein
MPFGSNSTGAAAASYLLPVQVTSDGTKYNPGNQKFII